MLVSNEEADPVGLGPVSLPGGLGGRRPGPARSPPVHALRIVILSTMLAERAGIGQWGFAALVEVDGKRFLFDDTGSQPETVLINARALSVDLSNVTEVILSHNHADHTGGLLRLRRSLAAKNPAALTRVHVARGSSGAGPRRRARATRCSRRVRTSRHWASSSWSTTARPS